MRLPRRDTSEFSRIWTPGRLSALTVQVLPYGDVKINGENHGRAPQVVRVLPGSYTVEVRIGLLGDSRMIISRATPFSVASAITPTTGSTTSAGKITVSGVPTIATITAANWTMAAWRT